MCVNSYVCLIHLFACTHLSREGIDFNSFTSYTIITHKEIFFFLLLIYYCIPNIVRRNNQKPRTNAEIPFKTTLASAGHITCLPCLQPSSSSSTPFIALFAIAKNRSRDVPPKSLLVINNMVDQNKQKVRGFP